MTPRPPAAPGRCSTCATAGSKRREPMIRVARLLNLRRIRQQPMRAALAVLAVAGGVALGASLLVVTNSVKESYGAFGRALGGPARLRVVGAVGRGGLDEAVVAKVEHTPGVA